MPHHVDFVRDGGGGGDGDGEPIVRRYAEVTLPGRGDDVIVVCWIELADWNRGARLPVKGEVVELHDYVDFSIRRLDAFVTREVDDIRVGTSWRVGVVTLV